MILKREFVFLFRKILTILIISLVKIGEAPVYYQNNAFFILILNSIFFSLELRLKPFGIIELNKLNSTSNLIMMITIFGGLISSINQQSNLSFIMMILIMCFNSYFMLLFLKYFIQIKLSFTKNFKSLFYFLNKFSNKFWSSGI